MQPLYSLHLRCLSTKYIKAENCIDLFLSAGSPDVSNEYRDCMIGIVVVYIDFTQDVFGSAHQLV